MSFYPCDPTRPSFEAALAPFLRDESLPFADVLPESQIREACLQEGVRFGETSRSVYTPAVTLWALLSQVLAADKTCLATTMRVLVLVISLGRDPCSTDTGMFCRAKAKLPTSLVRRLTYEVADQLEAAVPEHWLWKGRHVHLVDGTTLSMPDTPENQKAWPQPSTQKPGLGFPMIRLVVLLSLATTLVTGMALGPYQGKQTGETALFRSLLDRLQPGCVVLGDCHYCSYFMIALLSQKGVDVVFRMHQCRRIDFRRGERLGHDDHVVVWERPPRPEWMDPDTYASMPLSMRIREIRRRVHVRGFRVRELVVASTILDAREASPEEITDLYRQRWHVELDIRSIKVTLAMETLCCLSPRTVRQEIWATILGYNLVRKVSCQAALLAREQPRRISFKASLDAVRGGWESLTSGRRRTREVLGKALLKALGKEVVGDRPDRCEPRAKKRRPKVQEYLMVPRAQARAALLAE